jgi:hypothetical protein
MTILAVALASVSAGEQYTPALETQNHKVSYALAGTWGINFAGWVLAEFYSLTAKKLGMKPEQAKEAVADLGAWVARGTWT